MEKSTQYNYESEKYFVKIGDTSGSYIMVSRYDSEYAENESEEFFGTYEAYLGNWMEENGYNSINYSMQTTDKGYKL